MPLINNLKCIGVTTVLTAGLLTACARHPLDPGTPQHQLIVAARRGDTESVRRLLKSGVSIETSQPQGPTALAIAAEYGRADTVKLLLEQGANIAAAGLDGDGAIIEAARIGNVAKLKLLLERGADVRLKNEALLEAAAFSIATTETPIALPGAGKNAEEHQSPEDVPFPSPDRVQRRPCFWSRGPTSKPGATATAARRG
jgi:ankyrin repeat protein